MAAAGEPIFRVTSRIRQFAELVNAAKLEIVGALILRVASKAEDLSVAVFSPEEQEQVRTTTGWDAASTGLFVGGASFIFETAAFHGLSAAQLGDELVSLGIAVEKIALFQQAWDAHARRVVATLRKTTLGGPSELAEATWQTMLHLGHAGKTAARDSGAVVELRLTSDVPVGAGDAAGGAATTTTATTTTTTTTTKTKGEAAKAGEERVVVEFSQAELFELLGKLDQIQRQIDTLSN